MNWPATVSEQAMITAASRAVSTASARLASARTSAAAIAAVEQLAAVDEGRDPLELGRDRDRRQHRRHREHELGAALADHAPEAAHVAPQTAELVDQAAHARRRLGQRLVVELDHLRSVAEHLPEVPGSGDDDVELPLAGEPGELGLERARGSARVGQVEDRERAQPAGRRRRRSAGARAPRGAAAQRLDRAPTRAPARAHPGSAAGSSPRGSPAPGRGPRRGCGRGPPARAEHELAGEHRRQPPRRQDPPLAQQVTPPVAHQVVLARRARAERRGVLVVAARVGASAQLKPEPAQAQRPGRRPPSRRTAARRSRRPRGRSSGRTRRPRPTGRSGRRPRRRAARPARRSGSRRRAGSGRAPSRRCRSASVAPVAHHAGRHHDARRRDRSAP